MALAIGGPSGFEPGMMSLLELIDVGERRVSETAQSIAFRDHPMANPSVTRWLGSRRFLSGHAE